MRAKRVEYPGAVYHVMQRGNNKQDIFKSDQDKIFFTAELANSGKKFNCDLFGYVLLNNHYHLLLRTNEQPLSKFMQRLNSLYSRYHNRVHKRIDHLFGLRYKALVIQDDRYLFAVLRYLHWNPVQAGLVQRIENYHWSSDRFYRQGEHGLVDPEFMLAILAQDRQTAIKEYCSLMGKDPESLNAELKLAYGGSDQGLLREPILDESLSSEDYQLLASLLRATGLTEEQFTLIKARSRQRALKSYKAAFIDDAYERGYSYQTIAGYLGLSVSAVHKIHNEKR